MDRIESKENSHIKELMKLNSSSKERREKGLFLVEGIRLCEEATKNGFLYELLVTKEAFEKHEADICAFIDKAEKAFEISGQVEAKLAQTQSPQGVFGVCKALKDKKNTHDISKDGKYLLLENIQDPANLGAVCRIADALGISGIIVAGGCDIYNPKAQRASMGSLFRIDVFETEDAVKFIENIKNQGMLTVASTPCRDAEKITEIDFLKGAVCVVGNEGNGVTREMMDACEKVATIPMSGKAESLNASTAAAIIAWEMVR